MGEGDERMTTPPEWRCETCEHDAEVHTWHSIDHLRCGCWMCDCASYPGPQMPPPPTKWRPAYVVAYDNYIAALAALRTPEEGE